MLSTVRKAALRTPLCLRVLSTLPSTSAASETAPRPTLSSILHSDGKPERRRRPNPRTDRERSYTGAEQEFLKRTVFVRTESGVASIVDAFTYARAIERKYGAVRQVVFSKDPDISSRYQPFFWIVFEDPAARDQFSETTTVVQVRIPSVEVPEGGLGLDVLHELMSPVTFEPNVDLLDGPEDWHVAEIRIDRAKNVPLTGLYRQRFQSPKFQRDFSHKWSRWGGFSTTTPPIEGLPPQPNLLTVNQKWLKIRGPLAAEAEGEAKTSQERDQEADEQEATANTPSVEEWISISKTMTPPAVETIEAGESSTSEDATSAEPEPAKLSRRERILHLARQNARTPLPKREVTPSEPAEEEIAEAKRQSIRERLWKLVGGGHL